MLAEARVLSNRQALPGAWLLRLVAPGLTTSARPGQILLLRATTGPHPALRTALPLHRIGQGDVSLLFGAADDGLAALARCREGDLVSVQGPLGHGFQVKATSRHLLLAAEGLGVAALTPLAAWAVAHGLAVTLLAAAATATALLPAALLPAEVEYRLATSDGSLGHRGDLLDLLAPDGETSLLLWADQVFAAGSTGFYLGLRQAITAVRTQRIGGFAQVMVDGRLGCGLGSCLGCAIQTRRGIIYLCKHGPVLDLNDLLL
jgi:dihydroorotate dehydrogenase electron transfer subunit